MFKTAVTRLDAAAILPLDCRDTLLVTDLDRQVQELRFFVLLYREANVE
jgi:hypothetical protein